VRVESFADPAPLFVRAAQLLAESCAAAMRARGVWHLALSGGSTPLGLYRLLAADATPRFDLARTHLWWSDERCVFPDHPESNYGMAWQNWARKLALMPGHVHRIRGEIGAKRAAADYAAELKRHVGDPVVLDCVLLGLGEDGHTASLFPGRPEAWDESVSVVAGQAPVAPRDRVSLSRHTLRSARQRIFLVVGPRKTQAWSRVRSGDAQLVASELVHEATILVSPESLAM
jgi:6-phosphogluconolactonase